MEWENCVKRKFNFSLISVLVLILFLSSSVYSTGPILTDEELLDSTEAKAANYFYEQATATGFVKDIQTTPYSSTAATGFGLAAFTVMSERYGTNSNWTYTPEQLRARTNLILDNILIIQNNQAQNPLAYGAHGMLYHFINSDNTNAGSEISTVDSALLFAGVITVGEYFGGEVKQKADAIINNVDWGFFQKTPENNFATKDGNTNMYQFVMSWSPVSGYSTQCWDRPTDEALLISVLALATDPNNLDFQKSLFSWQRTTRSYAGYDVVNSYFGTLFSYEFAHFFIDFEKIGADMPEGINPSAPSVDWWQNSINAAKANRQFCINNSETYSSYGEDSWGLSSAYRPNGTYFGELGALPNDNMYANHDGTIAPYSSISTMPFFKNEDSNILTNNLGFRVLRNLYDTRYDSLWGSYGPKDSFNDKNAVSSKYLGLDQGPIVISIENYRSSLVMNQFMKNTSIKAGLKKVFTCPDGVCDTQVLCSLDSQCNDDNSLTSDACINPGTVQSYCGYTPFVACHSDFECNDNNLSTDDLCLNPGTPSSYCSFIPNGKTCVVPTSGMQITESTTFCYGGYGTHDINIAADNIVVDCAGASFWIPIGAYSRFTIMGRSNVTLKNCIIGKSTSGILISKSNKITLSNNIFRGSYDTAIYAMNSSEINIIDNNIFDNEYQNGIYFSDVNDSNVSNNYISNNGYRGTWGHKGAIAMQYSYRNKFINNNISDNYRAFFITYYSGNNYFANNRLCGNTIENTCGSGTVGNTGFGNIIPNNYGVSCPWFATNSKSCESSCDDSMDSGLDYFVKGITTFWDGVTAGSNTDYCVDNSTVKEYFCSPQFSETTSNCTYGCKDGACLREYVCGANKQCAFDINSVIGPNPKGVCIVYTEQVPRMSDKLVITYEEPMCTQGDTPDASCNELTQLRDYVVEECPYGCENDKCLFAPVCNSDMECGSDTNHALYCDKNNLVQANNTFTCINPSTQNAACVKNNGSILVEACANGCSNAKCNILCSNNSQCGTNGIIGKVCNGNYLYDTLRTFTCNNAGTSNAYCSSIDANTLNQICNYGCLSGACISESIVCSADAECNDSNPNTRDTCVNPGTVSSVCNHTQVQITCSNDSQCNDSNPNTVDTCVNPGTVSSVCNHTQVQITCSNDSQCNDGNPNTVDTCVNPGTAQSYCTNVKPAIVCSSAAQCGVNGWLGQTTCNGKNIGDYFRTYSCVNPGKTTSYCKTKDVLKTKSYCPSGTLCSNGVCVTPACKSSSGCNDSNPYTKDACINPGKLNSACTHTPIACLSKTDCDDSNPFTMDVCKNPKKTTSYCTHTQIACTNDLSCNDNNPYTLDKCSRPNTTSSKCVYTSVKCSTNMDCDDFNPETSNVCMKAGTSKSYCSYYPKIPQTVWSLSPTSGGVVFNSATCDVVTKRTCPNEMGWEGRKVTYKFVLPQGDLTNTLDLKFNVNYRNYGTSKNVLLKISAGSSSTSLKVVIPSLEINRTGEFTVSIPKSYFKQGSTNYIQLYGTNITPTGYGTNPPNFQINSISLNQVQ